MPLPSPLPLLVALATAVAVLCPAPARAAERQVAIWVRPVFGDGMLDVRIRARSGQELWRCTSTVTLRRYGEDVPCPAPSVHLGRGTYHVELVSRSDELRQGKLLQGTPVREQVALQLDGRELRLQIAVFHGGGVHILRVLPADAGVKLEPLDAPGRDGRPRFRIVNGSQRALHGDLIGSIARGTGRAWEHFPRGGTCGTGRGATPPLPPGGSRIVREGYFISPPQPFGPGRYRFIVLYHTSPRMPGQRTATVTTSHEVATEFHVR